MKNTIHWLGHATVLIEGDKRVMLDPWKVQGAQPVDLVLVTHGHFDHCSPEDVDKVRGPHTEVAAPAEVAAKLGKGHTSRNTPTEIERSCEATGQDANRLVYAIRMSATVDSAAVQDG